MFTGKEKKTRKYIKPQKELTVLNEGRQPPKDTHTQSKTTSWLGKLIAVTTSQETSVQPDLTHPRWTEDEPRKRSKVLEPKQTPH